MTPDILFCKKFILSCGGTDDSFLKREKKVVVLEFIYNKESERINSIKYSAAVNVFKVDIL